MFYYILKRLALIIPTLLGILLINFLIIQTAPGGPVDQMVAQLQGLDQQSNMGGENSSDVISQSNQNRYGIDSDLLAEIEKQYGFDKPMHERFFLMLKQYITLDFGESYYRSVSVIE